MQSDKIFSDLEKLKEILLDISDRVDDISDRLSDIESVFYQDNHGQEYYEEDWDYEEYDIEEDFGEDY